MKLLPMVSLAAILLLPIADRSVDPISIPTPASTSIEAPPAATSYVVDQEELRCMQENIYFEAGNQPIEGMRAVAAVTMNRVNSPRFAPKTVCGIVHQKTGKMCQFSWVCQRRHVAIDPTNWAKAGRVALHALTGTLRHSVGEALFFHNTSVHPFRGRTFIVKIGDHLFYK